MLLDANDTLLLLIDLQSGLMPKVKDTEKIARVTNKLVTIARELSVPFLVTEHYPEGLKGTTDEIKDHLGEDYRPIVKRVFSCWGEESFRGAVEESGRKTLLMTGIETHICILQTALQCREAGYSVFVARDGVSCRSAFDHQAAFERMMQAGVELVTWEMVAYEWMRRADTPEFKTVLPHIKPGLS